MAEPHLSVVAVGRNDNYGGDFRSRLQAWVNWTFHQLSEQKISSELIFVNYNPLEGVAIEEFIDWPRSNQWVKVRIITVSHQDHAEVVHKRMVKDVPVLEYVAKNVGIRRANGKFIMVMNPDILISEEIFSSLTKLRPDSYYRANRVDHDFDGVIVLEIPLRVQLKNHVGTIWFKGSQTAVQNFSKTEYLKLWLQNGIQNRWRLNTIHFEKLLNFLSIPVYYDNIEYRFHCNASGDIMIMHRDQWHLLEGYKETAVISLHVDALMVLRAAFSGLKEKVFWYPIFHRQHERRYDAVNKETEDQKRVYIQFKHDVQTMRSTGRPVHYEQDDWGLADVVLIESDI